MSTRQNKKRKGRNNVNNRERTVTTLTEDPNTSFLVPTPSEEPAGVNLMSSPFSVTSSSGGGPPSNIPASPGFPLPGNFYGGYNYLGPMGPPMHGPNVHHSQQHQPFFTNLPPGQSDLEKLEKLKDQIKSGQHDIYRAVPQPAALASLYQGPATQSQVPHHPEQGPSDFQGPGFPTSPYDVSAANNPINSSGSNSAPSSAVDLGRRPSRRDTKDNWEVPGTRKNTGPPSVSDSQMPNNVLSTLSHALDVFTTNVCSIP
jgi:hypothetical protein